MGWERVERDRGLEVPCQFGGGGSLMFTYRPSSFSLLEAFWRVSWYSRFGNWIMVSCLERLDQ